MLGACSFYLFFRLIKIISAVIAAINIIKSWNTPIFIAALSPTIAHNEGIINKDFGNLLFVSINNPKVNIVEGHGSPIIIVFSNEPSTK
jgi:hypothetical protein